MSDVLPDHLVTVSPDHRVFASPRARKLAEEKGIDLARAGITPTGGEGVRVTEKDVLAYLASAPKVTPVAQKLAAEAGVDLRLVTGTGPGGKITKDDVEQAIARGAEEQRSRGAEERRSRFQYLLPNTRYPVPRFQPPNSSSASRSRACVPSSRIGWGPACTPRPV